jgi:hypothetical protein
MAEENVQSRRGEPGVAAAGRHSKCDRVKGPVNTCEGWRSASSPRPGAACAATGLPFVERSRASRGDRRVRQWVKGYGAATSGGAAEPPAIRAAPLTLSLRGGVFLLSKRLLAAVFLESATTSHPRARARGRGVRSAIGLRPRP